MNLGQVGASPQQAQPQIRQLERIEFSDDSGRSFNTFENVSATRPADTNQSRTGFGIDLNNDGVYSNGADGLLALDMDGDGKYTSTDVQNTSNYLKALNGETDLNGDGEVSFQERKDAHNMLKQFGSIDLDQDGVIQGWELSEMGAMVVTLGTDGDGNPTSQIQELPGFEADRIPPQPNIFDPGSQPPNPEFDAWRNSMWSQWSSVLGIDLFSALGNPQNSPQGGGGGFQFPPITANMFGGGGGGGLFGGGGGGFGFPQFNFASFNPMAGQTFDSNGFPSFFSQGMPFI